MAFQSDEGNTSNKDCSKMLNEKNRKTKKEVFKEIIENKESKEGFLLDAFLFLFRKSMFAFKESKKVRRTRKREKEEKINIRKK